MQGLVLVIILHFAAGFTLAQMIETTVLAVGRAVDIYIDYVFL